jgi:hypothetical protein
MGISVKVADRISSQIKKYQAIVADAQSRDVSESDTVVIVVDMLANVLGYKKYLEIRTEHSMSGTYIELAVKAGNEVRFVIEAIGIGTSLKDHHVKPAIDYAVENGIEWIVITNAVMWEVYKVHFKKQPIDKSLISEFNLLQANPKDPQLIQCLGNLAQSSMTTFVQQCQVTSKFSIAGLLLSEPMLDKLRREIRRLSPGRDVRLDELESVLRVDVLKRDVIDSQEAKEAADFLKKAARSGRRARTVAATEDAHPSTIAIAKERAPDAGGRAA